jgi:hypothetical protein
MAISVAAASAMDRSSGYAYLDHVISLKLLEKSPKLALSEPGKDARIS